MITTYFQNLILGNVFHTQQSPAIPANYFLGLSTTAPNADGTGVTEPTDSAYARVGLVGLSVPDSGEIVNQVDILFQEATSYWGGITHFVIFDASTGGNLLAYGPLRQSVTIYASNQINFRANSLTISIANPT